MLGELKCPTADVTKELEKQLETLVSDALPAFVTTQHLLPAMDGSDCQWLIPAGEASVRAFDRSPSFRGDRTPYAGERTPSPGQGALTPRRDSPRSPDGARAYGPDGIDWSPRSDHAGDVVQDALAGKFDVPLNPDDPDPFDAMAAADDGCVMNVEPGIVDGAAAGPDAGDAVAVEAAGPGADDGGQAGNVVAEDSVPQRGQMVLGSLTQTKTGRRDSK